MYLLFCTDFYIFRNFVFFVFLVVQYCRSVIYKIKRLDTNTRDFGYRKGGDTRELQSGMVPSPPPKKKLGRVTLNDSSSSYEDLLSKLNMTTLEAGRVQSMMVTLYKCLHGMVPPNLRAYIQERRVSDYNLRG